MTPLFQNKHSYWRKNIIAELSTLRFLNVILLALGQKDEQPVWQHFHLTL